MANKFAELLLVENVKQKLVRKIVNPPPSYL
jgi:hypothetical protein